MPELEISASIHNLPPLAEVMGNYAMHEDFLAEAGYKGFQYAHVVRPPFYGVAEKLAAAGKITSLHQSFTGHRLTELPYRIALGSIDSSVNQLEPLQRVPGVGKLPIVVHPNEQWLDNRPPDRRRNINYQALRQSRRFGALLFQPTIELLPAWNIPLGNMSKAAQHLVGITRAWPGDEIDRGFDGIALDTHHLISKRAGRQFTKEQYLEFAGGLATLNGIAELQISFRPDFGDGSVNLKRALNDRLADTSHGRIMSAVVEAFPDLSRPPRITVEVPSSAFEYTGHLPYLEGNRLLVEAIHSHWANAISQR